VTIFFSIGRCFERFCPLQLFVIEETKVEPKFTPRVEFVTIFFSIGRCFERFCPLQLFVIEETKVEPKWVNNK
jgi:hypothetical protein